MLPEENNSSGPYRLLRGIKIAAWGGARYAGETGVEVVEGFAVQTVFEIPAVPDFSAERFPDLARLDESQRISVIASRQAQFISALHQLGPLVGLSLRYCLYSQENERRRIKILLIGRAFGSTQAEAFALAQRIRQIVLSAFPREYRLEEVSDWEGELYGSCVELGGVSSIVEIIKPEKLIRPWHDPNVCGFSSYYRPEFFSPANNNMISVCASLLKNRAASVVIDVCLLPTPPMTDVEHGEARNWMALCDLWSRDQRVEVGGGLYSRSKVLEIGPDPAARDIGSRYEQVISTYFGADRLFLYAIRIMASDASPPVELAATVASAALAPGAGYYLRALESSDPAFVRALSAARYCSLSPAVCNESIWKREDAPETLRRLHRMASLDEIGGFFRFPIPGRSGCPGVPEDSGSVDSVIRNIATKTLFIGMPVEGNLIGPEAVVLPMRDLTKSALIVGMPGSGKTTLCFSILDQLWREHGVPFLVLEPAKTEYRALVTLSGLRDDLWVFSVGDERTSPFRLNPFEVPEGVAVSEHISGLVTCFSGAFDLWDPLPMIIEQAIRNAYENREWSEYERGGERPELEPPTMESVYQEALKIAARSSYRGETAGNIRGALESRLGSLLVGPKGRCFNNRRSIPLKELLSRPIVLELDSLNENEKALMMMFVLTLVREYTKASRRSGAALSHVLLVEEAHVVIGRTNNEAADGHANPKSVATRMFTRAIAEMRALGQGILIADQLPTAIAKEAVKNTSIKVMHRLVSAEDRGELGQAMIFDAGQVEQAATLSPGRAFIHMEGWARSRLVVEPDFKAMNMVEEPPDDRTIALLMSKLREMKEVRSAFLPYQGCENVCQTCSMQLREEIERACRGALLEVARSSDDSDPGSPATRAMEMFMRRAKIPEPMADVSFDSAVFVGDSMLPRDRLRLGCAGVFLVEVFLPQLNDSLREDKQ